MIHAVFALLTIAGQVLDYEQHWLVLTSGNAYRVAPGVRVHGTPAPERYARVTFDDRGDVVAIDTADTPFALPGDDAARQYAVSASPAYANPDLIAKSGAGRCSRVRPGRAVGVTITIEVPPGTSPLENVYMTSDQSGWNAQAYRLDRIDALHYRTTIKFSSGTAMHVLFDRGSMQSVQVQENGIEQQPYLLCVGDEDSQSFARSVLRWADQP